MSKIKLKKKISKLNELSKLSENNLLISDNIFNIENELYDIIDNQKTTIFNSKEINNNEKINNNEINNEKINNNQEINNNIQTIEYDDIISIDQFKKKEKMLYEILTNFFNKCTNEQFEMIINIINGNHKISLRFLDWFVTRYCYLYKLSISVKNIYNNESNFNINISYKAQLKSFKKKYFDPFRRKKKFYYEYNKNNYPILTTLGQLNFFRWALYNDIIKYTEDNYKLINDKINHVNSYFIKNIYDSNSLSVSSNSDENTDNIKSSDTKSQDNSDSIISSESDHVSKNNLNFIETNNNNTDIFINNNKIKKIKNSKIFNNLKNSQSEYKYPLVSRNICIEF